MRNYFYLPAKNAESREMIFRIGFALFRVFRAQVFFLPAVLISALSLTACFNSATDGGTNQNPPPAEVRIPDSNINLAKSLEVSNKAEDVALAKKIDELIEKSEFANARCGTRRAEAFHAGVGAENHHVGRRARPLERGLSLADARFCKRKTGERNLKRRFDSVRARRARFE
jgi:hypothetical protein